MNKGTDIPFESNVLNDSIGIAGIANMLFETDDFSWTDYYKSFWYDVVPEEDFDLEKYFYISLTIPYYYKYNTTLLSLNFNGEKYIIHILTNIKETIDTYESKSIILEISNSYFEMPTYFFDLDPSIVYYISNYDSDFFIYVIVDLLILSRIIYLRSKKRPFLGSFFGTKYTNYISLDRLTKDTLKDLERREELRNAMDPED